MKECVICDKFVQQNDYIKHLQECRVKLQRKSTYTEQSKNQQQQNQIRNQNRQYTYNNNSNQRHTINQEESKQEETKEQGEIKIPCPLCNTMINQDQVTSHMEQCLQLRSQSIHQAKKCTICNEMIPNDRYDGHMERCQRRQEKKQFYKQYMEEKKREEVTESMLMDPTLSFLQCIYCGKDILENKYEEHLIKCESEEQCDLCKQKYPKEIFRDHQKMCRIQFALQMGDIQPMVKCVKCNELVPANQFEQHQIMHISEEGGFGQEQLQAQNLDHLDSQTRQKVETLYNDPRNQEINNMNDDQLYRHFHDVDLEEFQKNAGIDKNELEQNLSQTFYRPNLVDNDEDKTCLICQEDFERHDKIRKLPCKHQFHSKCVDEWFQRNAVCPVCRKDIKEEIQTKKEQKQIQQQQTQKLLSQKQNQYVYTTNNNYFKNNNNNQKPQQQQISQQNTFYNDNKDSLMNSRIYNNSKNIMSNISGINQQSPKSYKYTSTQQQQQQQYQFQQKPPPLTTTTTQNKNYNISNYTNNINNNIPQQKKSVRRTVQNAGNNVLKINNNQQKDNSSNIQYRNSHFIQQQSGIGQNINNRNRSSSKNKKTGLNKRTSQKYLYNNGAKKQY